MATRSGADADQKGIGPLFWACVLGLIALVLSAVQRGFRGKYDYSLEEWFIRFPGHFMRRGLRGSIVMNLADALHISPYKLASFLSLALYAAAAFVAAKLIFNWLSQNARGWILPVLLSPAGLFFYFNSQNGAYRYDLMFVLLTVAHLELCLRSKTVQEYTKWAFLLFATLGVMAMLTSEVFLFIGIPINVILSIRRTSSAKATFLIFVLPILAAAACLLNPGTLADAQRIYETTPIKPSVDGPVSFIGMSARQEIQYVLHMTRTGGSAVLAGAILLLAGIHLALMHFLLKSTSPVELEPGKPLIPMSRIWIDLLVIPFVITIPLYVLGYDCGRWAAIVLTMFTLSVCRTTVINRPIPGLSLAGQAWVALPCLFVGLPSHIISPWRSMFTTATTGLVQIISHGGKPQATAQSTDADAYATGAATIYEAAPADKASLMIAGDSIALQGPWSELLNRPVLNRGVYSETSTQLLARVDELKRHHPDVLVLITGANDIRQKIPVDVSLSNIKALAQAGIAPRVLILGVLPSDPTILAPDQVASLNEGLRKSSWIWGAKYVAPPADFTPSYDEFDGLHPNGAGYRLICVALLRTL